MGLQPIFEQLHCLYKFLSALTLTLNVNRPLEFYYLDVTNLHVLIFRITTWLTPLRSRCSCASIIMAPRRICTSQKCAASPSHSHWKTSCITTRRDKFTTPGWSKFMFNLK